MASCAACQYLVDSKTHFVAHDLVKCNHEFGLLPPFGWLNALVNKIGSVVTWKDDVIEGFECTHG